MDSVGQVRKALVDVFFRRRGRGAVLISQFNTVSASRIHSSKKGSRRDVITATGHPELSSCDVTTPE